MTSGIKGFAIYGAVLAASLALFYWAPQVDLFVSGLFYDPVHGFTLATWPPVRDFTRSIRWIAWGILLVVLVGAAWLSARRPAALAARPQRVDLPRRGAGDRPRRARQYRAQGSLGPRPAVSDRGIRRPTPVHPGAAPRQPVRPQLLVRLRPRGARFFAGDVRVPGAGGRPRSIALAAALSFGALVGLARIVAGHHFLSDVVDAGLLVFGTTRLHWWLVVHDGLAAPAPICLYALGARAAAAAGEAPDDRRWRELPSPWQRPQSSSWSR